MNERTKRPDEWPVVAEVGRAICRAATGNCRCASGEYGIDCCDAFRREASFVISMIGITTEEADLLKRRAATVRRKPTPKNG